MVLLRFTGERFIEAVVIEHFMTGVQTGVQHRDTRTLTAFLVQSLVD